MAVTIQSVKARQIFDSRGNPTVEVYARHSFDPLELEFQILLRRFGSVFVSIRFLILKR